ncbi:type 1 glutamine amidotransferase domain-containing protein [Sinorhizobium mexicanum]|uniref:Type 1 glutamine amidotransferase domain-containing protein n=1 Tax=Sinorhizobium mexicanum TaxID=375549 RepID=A0A859QMT4_9HYPH|nr:type 1 glutamine amidotransferase domain-containing protein [Sinorhizobium mexicanum]MBP1881836.1 putative intracellular protease/amidase [Sinorhizobium mexicanum]QLL61586.1 type 1 glutamine amidotransferase domain-containing protein [Sinorhizobium mexicanum]
MEPLRILMVATSHEELGATGRKTGLWLEGFAAPYYVFMEAGAIVTMASVEGGMPPIDPASLGEETGPATHRFRTDPAAQTILNHTMEISHARAEEFHGVFYAGGHGPMWDLATDRSSSYLLSAFAEQGKCIGAVCHAPAALLQVSVNGISFLEGRTVTAFSNEEEEALGLVDEMPFLLEDVLKASGAVYRKGRAFEPFVAVDRRLVTGQNPASSKPAALAFLDDIRKRAVFD